MIAPLTDELAEAAWAEHDDPRLEAPAHDPSWEVEPRWSPGDRRRHQERARQHDREHGAVGPGLVTARHDDGDSSRQVG